MIAEETGMPEDSIDYAYNRAVTDNIVRANKDRRYQFLPVEGRSASGWVERVSVKGEDEEAQYADLSQVDEAAYRQWMDAAGADYVLLLTFLCFFVFSSSIAANQRIAGFLERAVRGNEYWWSIGISQIISNVPASIVLWPFTADLRALIYGLDTAGLVTVIGSLASVINLRLYTREYPGQGKAFLVCFEKISLCFFAIVVVLQLFLL